MKNLTTGSVSKHLLQSTSFVLVTMVFQTLYLLVDLYWVGRLGTRAVAAVGIAGNLNFLVLALTQMLGVGTTAVIAQAVGAGDRERARLAFNQAQGLALLVGVALAAAGIVLRLPYVRAQSADAETAALAAEYLLWFIPALALQFGIVAMGAALRGTGNFRPGMIVGTATVILNIVFAPIFIFGWGTGRAFGATGAAMATLLALAVGVVWLTSYFVRPSAPLRFVRGELRPRPAVWRRILAIGLPTGVEFALMSVYMLIVYAVARPFGAAAQAGFGIGMRVVQSGFMPVVALGMSAAPVAGQNYGARLADRVRRTFRDAAVMAAGAMVLLALLCHFAPAPLVRAFTSDPAAIAVGVEYLRIVSWSFVASGIIFVASSMFQAMGNTIPSVVASAARLTIVAVPTVLLSRAANFQLHWIWYLSAASIWAQLAVSLLLLRREFRRRLTFAPAEPLGTAPRAVPATA